jgi:release factor glutamine methyltransferase
VLKPPALDGRVLLAQAMNCTQTWFYTNPDAVLSADDLARFDAMLARREMRVPVSHILGAREFWSRPFIVSPDVLTPRPDSETLIEAVLIMCRTGRHHCRYSILARASGCLLLTLLSEIPGALGTGRRCLSCGVADRGTECRTALL